MKSRCRLPHRALLPPLLLAVLHLHALAANESTLLPLSLDAAETVSVADLAEGERHVVNVQTAAAGHLLVEFIPEYPPRPDTEPTEQGLPSLILAATPGDESDLVVTTGHLMDVNSAVNHNRRCSVQNPCFREGPSVVDISAFYSMDDRYFVRLLKITSTDVTVSLTNYNRRFFLGDKPLTPTAHGMLRLLLVAEEGSLCPGFLSDEAPNCSGKGRCEDSNCLCDTGYVGPMCRQRLYDVRPPALPPPAPSPGPNGWLGPNVSDTAILTEIPPYQIRAFSWKQDRADTKVFLRARIMSGFNNLPSNHPEKSGTRLRAFWIPPGVETNFFPVVGPRDGDSDGQKDCGIVKREEEDADSVPFLCVVSERLTNGELFRFVLYANPAGATERPPRRVVVSFEINHCDGEGVMGCPRLSSAFLIPIAVLPICIATIGVTALTIVIMLWLDRRHGFTSSVDRLTEKELDRMYPSDKFQGGSVRGITETRECLICLCDYESDELIRKLQCEHYYHSECLDPWLIGNSATCPACRASVRIQNLSDKRHLRSMVTFCLAPIVWLRNAHSTWRGPVLSFDEDSEENDGPDLELGLEPLFDAGSEANHENRTEGRESEQSESEQSESQQADSKQRDSKLEESVREGSAADLVQQGERLS